MGLSRGSGEGRWPRHLFVYGTLCRSLRNPWAHYLAERAAWLGKARIAGRLYDLGRYPGLQRSRIFGEWVVGELYRLPDSKDVLIVLDNYEGAEFRRVRAVAQRSGRPSIQTWVYEYLPKISPSRRILSGEYLSGGVH